MSKVCKWCENSGIAFYPNGKDDYYQEYCICEAGKAREVMDEKGIDWNDNKQIIAYDKAGSTTVGDVKAMATNHD